MKPTSPATYEDLRALPAHQVGELIAGQLYASPRPSFAHAGAASVLGMGIGPPFQLGRGGPGGWWILFEPELHFGDDVLVPDLAGWRRERMPKLHKGAFHTLAPDWVCEVQSPSTARLDRVHKLPVYAREGAKHAWMIDPLVRTLESLRLEQGRWSLIAAHGDDELVRAEPFEAVELDLLLLWGEDREQVGGADEGEG